MQLAKLDEPDDVFFAKEVVKEVGATNWSAPRSESNSGRMRHACSMLSRMTRMPLRLVSAKRVSFSTAAILGLRGWEPGSPKCSGDLRENWIAVAPNAPV
jgi:hypothetical protein